MDNLEYCEGMNQSNYFLNRARKWLLVEFKKIQASPSSWIKVSFKEESILEWHFIFYGLKNTPFYTGEFHGKLLFPYTFPFSPPLIQFMTPNGKFKTNQDICFILSNFHPEHWKPSYTVPAVLEGVYYFMMCEKTETVGALPWDEDEIQKCAKASVNINMNNLEFCRLFKEQIHSMEQIISSLNEQNILLTKVEGDSMLYDNKDIKRKQFKSFGFLPRFYVTLLTRQQTKYNKVVDRRLLQLRMSYQSFLLKFIRKFGSKRRRMKIGANLIRMIKQKIRFRVH